MIKNYPPDPAADARNRAARTWWQNLAMDIAVSVLVSVALSLLDGDILFTAVYWIGVAVLALRSAATSVVAYITRLKMPPPL